MFSMGNRALSARSPQKNGGDSSMHGHETHPAAKSDRQSEKECETTAGRAGYDSSKCLPRGKNGSRVPHRRFPAKVPLKARMQDKIRLGGLTRSVRCRTEGQFASDLRESTCEGQQISLTMRYSLQASHSEVGSHLLRAIRHIH